MRKSDITKLILDRIDSLDYKIDTLGKQITEIALQQNTTNVKVEERTGKKAIIVASVGGLITFAATLAAAMLLK